MEPIHQSVLTREVLELLAPKDADGLLVDATVGEGGHSASFLQRFPGIRVIGVDADSAMLARARERLAEFAPRVELVHAWFDTFLSDRDVTVRPHRILMDLGISMYHLVTARRGFSFREAEPLDMRLDAGSPLESRSRSAAELVNTLDESALADLIFMYGEERLSRRIAAAICRERSQAPIVTAAQLADIIRGSVPPSYRHGRIHPATRTFQALRIAVNAELDRLQAAVPAALSALAPGGRLGIIAFHSLEDRIVKHGFRAAANDGPFRIVTKKPVIAADEERSRNAASRSAKLRVIERNGVDAGGQS